MNHDRAIDQVRRFERLCEGYARSDRGRTALGDFTVTDVRLVHEMGFFDSGGSGAWLAGRLGLDEGYVCRMLKKLEAHGLVTASRSTRDGRMKDWELTKAGRKFAAGVEKEHRSRADLALLSLRPDDSRELAAALGVVERFMQRCARLR